MTSLALIPVRVKSTWKPKPGTASQPRFATCDDQLDYCIKHDEGGLPVRANEWICTALARAVGIAVAPAAIVRDLDGKSLFGSQLLGDDTNDNLGLFAAGGLLPDHITHIWKTYAFDLFVRNEDRHTNQYKIFHQNRRDRIVSLDWGSALFCFWPNLDLPLSPTCTTMTNIRAMISIYGAFEINAANETLARLESVDGAAMVHAVKGLPRGWLSAKVGGEFLRWFASRARRERIARIRDGLQDGSYL